MKGLLIKDFKILLNQKRFLLMFICLAVILSFSMDSTFVVSYIPMIGLILMISTIAYDYNDDSSHKARGLRRSQVRVLHNRSDNFLADLSGNPVCGICHTEGVLCPK